MDGRPTWTDCDEARDYVVPNVLSPRNLVFRSDNMDETVPHTLARSVTNSLKGSSSPCNLHFAFLKTWTFAFCGLMWWRKPDSSGENTDFERASTPLLHSFIRIQIRVDKRVINHYVIFMP